MTRTVLSRRLLRERLELRAPDPIVRPVLAWSLHGLEGDAAPPSLAHGLALLATGGFEVAGRMARRAAETCARADGDAPPEALLLLARYLAWSGDATPLHAAWEAVRRAARRLGESSDDLETAALRVVALRDLAVAAETIGDETTAAALRRMEPAARRDATESFRRSGDDVGEAALALAFGAVDPLDAAAWFHARAGEALPDEAAWVSWAEFVGGSGDAAYRHWRTAADAAFGPTRKAWDTALDGDAGVAFDAPPPSLAASLTLPLVHGLLGAYPDAPRNRLQLRPQLPAEWEDAEALRIRMGDAEVTLRYHRDGDFHTFRLEQESGAIPTTVVFEPLLPARRLVRAEVDGHEATLDPRPHGERMLVPVQLVLDAERTVTLLVGDEAEPAPRGRELRVI